MSAPNYYAPSGKFSVPGVLAALIGAPLAASVVGVVYAYAIIYIPIGGWITFLLAIGAGFGMGALSGLIVRAGKSRNVAISYFVATISAALVLYVSWAVWVSLLMQRGQGIDLPTFYFVGEPVELVDTIVAVNAIGPWEMEGMSPKGGFLWALWGLEALLILGPAVAMVGFMSGPYCENCDRWCESDEELGRTSLDSSDTEFRTHAEQREWNWYRELGAPPSDAYFMKVSVESCPACGEMNALKTARVTISQDDNGNRNENADTVFEGLVIGSGDKAELRASLGSFR